MKVVTERPILFSGEMVSQIMRGAKIQTRRVIKPQPNWLSDPYHPDGDRNWYDGCGHPPVRCPYDEGMTLWVRETWAPSVGRTLYGADYDGPSADHCGIKWKPSIHMPRSASRITLRVVHVEPQRLQDIEIDDAIDEGAPTRDIAAFDWFRDLWDSLNKARGFGWEVNPWVWAVSFVVANGGAG